MSLDAQGFEQRLRSGNPGCLVVGEVGQAHDGSLGMAHAYIDAIATAGADAVKFQAHLADAESTADEPWRVQFSLQDVTRTDYWRRMEFTVEQWAGLREHAAERGLQFVVSPFSVEALEFLAPLSIDAWKVASGELSNTVLLDRLAKENSPVLLSTGMSGWDEIDTAVATLADKPFSVAVLQCSSEYPCPPAHVGLNMIEVLRDRYALPTGLSDHSGTIFPGLAATTLGAQVLEIHVTLSREAFGPDVPASITTDELRTLVQGIRFINEMQQHPVDKEAHAESFAELRRCFTKSLVARRPLQPGAVIAATDLTVKKPGTGIPPARLSEVIGRRVRRPIGRDQLLQPDDLEDSTP